MKNKLQKCRFSNLKSITAAVFLMFALSCFDQQLFAQFADDFSDGDFVSDPMWSGNNSKFVVESTRLTLKAPPLTDEAYLATASTSINDATWEFLVQLDFNPSTSNFARIYLISDQSNLSGALNGYFIELGNTSDDVSLYRQTGTSITRVIDGTDGTTDLAEVTIKVKVHRDHDGLWELSIDQGVGIYTFEGSARDQQHVTALYFGVLCNYTSTRADKFHFDDFSVMGESISDLTPPELTNTEPLSSQLLQLTFSEDVDTESAIELTNYHVTGVGYPVDVTLQDNRIIRLIFAERFAAEILYVLRVSGVRDKNGNVMNNAEQSFQLQSSVPVIFKDIIFTEIFADPSPNIGLPDVEFVEIFNASENVISLDRWTLSDGSSTMTLPQNDIGPGDYIILTSDPSLFPASIRSIGSSDFPSLNNSGDHLKLKDAEGTAIDSVYYTIDWYRDEKKKDGGWSLELIDPNNDCAESENWIASEDPSGGTPGIQNSVLASMPDVRGPILLSAIPVSYNRIRLIFNEKLQQDTPLPGVFLIVPPVGVKGVSILGQSRSELVLELADELEGGITYGLTVSSITDCAGNEIMAPSDHVSFGLPEQPLPSDVLINEILFDPRPGGVDFVELVNVSKKFFNLKDWLIGNFENDTITRALSLSTEDLLFSPGEYLALTEDIEILRADYPSAPEPNIFGVDDLPSLNDDEGSIALMSSDHVLLDHFNYSTTYHSVFINDPEGVSLERISLDVPSDEGQNWKSASTGSGYATPGYLNSNSRSNPVWTKSIQIEPEVFIPLYGQPDFVIIHYEFDRGGYIGNIDVLDAQGHHVKQLAISEILGTSGSYRWDGDRDNGNKARVGYYMVRFEVFDDTGEVRLFLNRVVVATKF